VKVSNNVRNEKDLEKGPQGESCEEKMKKKKRDKKNGWRERGEISSCVRRGHQGEGEVREEVRFLKSGRSGKISKLLKGGRKTPKALSPSN